MRDGTLHEEQLTFQGIARVLLPAGLSLAQLAAAGVCAALAMQAEGAQALVLGVVAGVIVLETPVLIWLLLRMKTVVRVDRQGVHVRAGWANKRTYSHDEVASVDSLNGGTRLKFTDGRSVHLGSTKPERLRDALERYT